MQHKQTIVLLHGYPSSSHSYRELIPLLSGRYHVIAPDYLGSGYSARPNPETQKYTFEELEQLKGFKRFLKPRMRIVRKLSKIKFIRSRLNKLLLISSIYETYKVTQK